MPVTTDAKAQVDAKVLGPDEFSEAVFGITPLPYQAEFLNNWSQEETLCWGRRTGKSTTEAIKIAYFALKTPDSKQWIVGPTEDQAKIIFETLEGLVESRGLQDLLARPTVHVPFCRMNLRVRGGVSEIHARGCSHRGKYLRGRAGHRVILEEAQIIPNEIVEGVIGPMLADNDGQLDKLGTPFGRNHFWQSFVDGQTGNDPGVWSSHVTSLENPHISQRYIRSRRGRVTELQWQTEYMANFADLSDRPFPWEQIQDMIDLEMRIPLPFQEGMRFSIGGDIAQKRDWNVITALEYSQSPYRLGWFDRFQLCGSAFIEERFRVAASHCRTHDVLLDATGMGTFLPEGLRDIGAKGFVFTLQKKLELIRNLQLIVEHREFKMPYIKTMIDEFLYFEQEQAVISGKIRVGTQDAHDDTVISTALAAWKLRKKARLPTRISMV